jgi:hypothetical protein
MSVARIQAELATLEQVFADSFPGPLRDSLAVDIVALRSQLTIAQSLQSIPSKQAA